MSKSDTLKRKAKGHSENLASSEKKKKVRFAAYDSSSPAAVTNVKFGSKNANSESKSDLGNLGDKKRLVRTGTKLATKLAALSRKDRKTYLRKLKASKRPYYELAMNAKNLWEKLRSKKVSVEEKEKLSIELYKLVEGKAKQLIFAHDTVRVFQCLMALKNAEIRNKLFEELKGDIVELSKMKYSKFFVIKMLKYGSAAQRSHVVKCLYGQVVDLMRHNVACDVVEYAYNQYADSLQRSRFCTEFYGKEFQLFKVEEAVSLKDVLCKEPAKKALVQNYLLENIVSISTKVGLRHSLTHHVCLEYLRCFPDQRTEILESLTDRVAEIVHTKDGSLIAMHCVWFGSVKRRKAVVKSLKGLVVKACQEEHGHTVLMAIFDSVDDTVTVAKYILKEIKEHLSTVLANKFGVRVVLYLLNARDKRHFNSQMIATLSAGDRNKISKKSTAQRSAELLADISPSLIAYAAENAREMIFESTSFPLLFSSICQYASGDKSPAYEALCQLAGEEFIPCNVERVHLIEHNRGHYVFSHLLKNDRNFAQLGLSTLSQFLVDHLSDETFDSWMSCNKGCFVLINMIESGVDSVKSKLLGRVSVNRNKLSKYSFQGAKILLEKLRK